MEDTYFGWKIMKKIEFEWIESGGQGIPSRNFFIEAFQNPWKVNKDDKIFYQLGINKIMIMCWNT